MARPDITVLVYGLSPERLRELYNIILETGIMYENGKVPKNIFRTLRNKSSGNLKKLYSILAKCSFQDYETFYKLITEELYENN